MEHKHVQPRGGYQGIAAFDGITQEEEEKCHQFYQPCGHHIKELECREGAAPPFKEINAHADTCIRAHHPTAQ